MKMTKLFSFFLAFAVILSVAVFPAYATTPEEDAAARAADAWTTVLITAIAVILVGILIIAGALALVGVVAVKEKKAKPDASEELSE